VNDERGGLTRQVLEKANFFIKIVSTTVAVINAPLLLDTVRIELSILGTAAMIIYHIKWPPHSHGRIRFQLGCDR